MKIRIYWKITVVFAAVIIATFFSLYYTISAKIGGFVESRIEDTLSRDVLLAADLVQERVSATDGISSVHQLADGIGERTGMRVTVMDSQGRVIGDSEIKQEDLPSIENHSTRVEVQQAIEKGFGKSKRFSTTIKQELLYMATPVMINGEKGVVRLAMSLEDIYTAKDNVRKALVSGLFVICIFVIAAGAVISLIISRPIMEIRDIALALADGDFSRKSVIRSRDELEDLSRAINDMADKIRLQIDKISSDKARIEAILSSMFEGLMITDPKGAVTHINPSLKNMVGVAAFEQGTAPIEIVRNNDVQGLVDKVLSSGGSHVSCEISAGTEAQKILVVSAAPIRRDGNTEGAVLVFHDITEIKRLENIRRDFVANVSHELRTPVSSIKGYSETLLDGYVTDPKKAAEFIGIIHDESNRLVALIEDLLDLAKIESGTMSADMRPLDPAPVLTYALNVVKKKIEGKNLKESIEISDTVSIIADEKSLAQVFINLLDNAVKYTPEGGTVTVRCQKSGNFARFEISDTGIGIPEKDLPRLFERFYRVDKARSRELGGTGLGLAIVKHIVLAHGGQVDVRSAPGEGSTFSVFIPLA